MNQKNATIDLSTGEISSETIPQELRRLFLGGRGINIHLLYGLTSRFTSALSEEAPLIIGAGLLSGLPCPSASRCSITAISPETDLLGDSNIGGFFAAQMRKTGFDHLVIRGRADHPVYVFIDEETIQIRDATHLWGRDTIETTRLLKREHGKDCEALCIGPAGEALVRFACVRHGLKSTAGRGGLGCTMGSKRLKAVAVRGDRRPLPAHRRALVDFTKALNEHLLVSKTVQTLQKFGTPFLFDLHNFKGIVRTFNGRLNRFTEGKALRASSLKDHYTAHRACFGCVIACRHRYRIYRREQGQTEAEGPEYGTLAAFGPICGLSDPGTILELNDVVNRYGLDSVTTGNIIAWVMELFQEGILTPKDTMGLELRWGNRETILELVHQIAFRRGFGAVLADGPKVAAKSFGPASEAFLNWVKHLIQSDSVDVRAHKGFALSVATATRGADHLRSRPTLEALSLEEGQLQDIYGAPVAADPTSYEGKARMVWWSEREYALADALGICRFAQRFNSPDHLGIEDLKALVYYATGMEFSTEAFALVGERITTLDRMFLVRRGVGRQDDTLPSRYFEPMPGGRYRGEAIDPDQFQRMLDEYYALHGWDSAGIPKKETLEALGLDHTVHG